MEEYCLERAEQEFTTKSLYHLGYERFSKTDEELEILIDNAMDSKWDTFVRFKEICSYEHFLELWLPFMNTEDSLGYTDEIIELII